MRLLTSLLCSAILVAAQDEKKPEPKALGGASQARIDDAIRKGLAYVMKANSIGNRQIPSGDDLVLYTLVSAGVAESDPKVRELWTKMLAAPLDRTYCAALRAMIFEEVDRVKYQPQIVRCAQFLVDNQCANGQWSYGEPIPPSSDVATPDVASARPATRKPPVPGDPGARVKPKVLRKVGVRRTRTGPAEGDNSNSQYAALGLRACYDAGVIVPHDVLVLGQKWWKSSQHGGKTEAGKLVATGDGGGEPRGWCYAVKDSHAAYGSMTAGAVGAAVIYDYLLDKDWKKDPVVKSGLAWMAQNFSVGKNVGPAENGNGQAGAWLFYYLYALERVGMLYDTESIGDHAWYAEGAEFIVGRQKPDGSFEPPDKGWGDRYEWDTCFAILFLKRATARLGVATPSAGSSKP
jgi:hypothetical protein